MKLTKLELTLYDNDLKTILAQVGKIQQGMSPRTMAQPFILSSVEDLSGKFLPGRVSISGKYPVLLGFSVPFETTWLVRVAGSIVDVKIDTVDISGVPGNILRGAIMRSLDMTFKTTPGVSVSVDQGLISIDGIRLARAASGIDLDVSFRDIRLEQGFCTLIVGEN